MAHIQDHIKTALTPLYGDLNVTELLKSWRADQGIDNQADEDAFYVANGLTTTGSFNDKMYGYWSSPIREAVAYWKAANYSGSGDLLDESGRDHHLTIAGPTFDTDHFEFDGTSDTMECANHADFNFTLTESFTLVLALEVAAAQTACVFMAKRTSALPTTAAVGWSMLATNSSLSMRTIIDDGAAVGAATATITVATPTLWAGVRNTSIDRVTTILNGASGTAATDNTTGTLTNTEVLRIGDKTGAGGSQAQMTFYGAAIIRRALTVAELATLAAEFGI